jgi:hypothetical protein
MMTAESAIVEADGTKPQERRVAPRFEAKIRIKVKEESFTGFIVNCSTSGFLVQITETEVEIQAFANLRGDRVTVSIFYMMHKLGDFVCRLVRAEENERGRFIAFQYDSTPASLVRKLVSIVENR